MILLEQVERQFLQRKLIRDGEPLLVAVSGGLDSMALLHILRRLASGHGWQITVMHFNHRLRGRASDADEKFVRQICRAERISLEAGGGEVKSFARQSKLSIEMAARKLRHEFFARTAKAKNIRTIALAHHADDQVELFFLRLLRGAGGEGLAGMKWISSSPVDEKIQLIRPLLNQSKNDLEEYARANGIRFREDASNASLDFQRNKIRHKLIPFLKKEFQPALIPTLLRTMEIVGEESAFVGEITRQWLNNPATAFAGLPVAVQRRVLLEQILEAGLPHDAQLIERLRGRANLPISLSSDVVIERDESGRVSLRQGEMVSFRDELVSIDTFKKGKIHFGHLGLSWKRVERSGDKFSRKERTEFFDADKVGDKIALRYWRPGDRFQPIGMKTAVKLQDLFTNAKISRVDRHRKVVAVTENGEIFWVEGLRIGERFKLMASSARRLVWSWRFDKSARSGSRL